MTVTYCTHSDVSGFLQTPAFSVSTTPTSTIIEDRINEAEDFIDSETGHAWRSVTVTNEYHDVAGVYERGIGFPIYLDHRAVKSLANASGDKLEVWDGSSWVDWLTESSREEGRDKDYWLRYEMGVLYIRSSYAKPVSVRITYRYGETSVPKDIKKAAVLLTAIDVISSDDRSVQIAESNSQVNYLNKIEKWEAQVKTILDKRREFRTFNL